MRSQRWRDIREVYIREVLRRWDFNDCCGRVARVGGVRCDDFSSRGWAWSGSGYHRGIPIAAPELLAYALFLSLELKGRFLKNCWGGSSMKNYCIAGINDINTYTYADVPGTHSGMVATFSLCQHGKAPTPRRDEENYTHLIQDQEFFLRLAFAGHLPWRESLTEGVV